MRIVLDTNIYISSLISATGSPSAVISRWLNEEFEVLISQPILDEFLRVVSYPKFQKYHRVKENQREIVQILGKQAILIESESKHDVVTADESDNRYIECAVFGGADYIVTGDKHLLLIGEYRGIYIINPATFLHLIE